MNTDGQTWQGCGCHMASEPEERADTKGSKMRNKNKGGLDSDTEALEGGRKSRRRMAGTEGSSMGL